MHWAFICRTRVAQKSRWEHVVYTTKKVAWTQPVYGKRVVFVVFLSLRCTFTANLSQNKGNSLKKLGSFAWLNGMLYCWPFSRNGNCDRELCLVYRTIYSHKKNKCLLLPRKHSRLPTKINITQWNESIILNGIRQGAHGPSAGGRI